MQPPQFLSERTIKISVFTTNSHMDIVTVQLKALTHVYSHI